MVNIKGLVVVSTTRAPLSIILLDLTLQYCTLQFNHKMKSYQLIITKKKICIKGLYEKQQNQVINQQLRFSINFNDREWHLSVRVRLIKTQALLIDQNWKDQIIVQLFSA